MFKKFKKFRNDLTYTQLKKLITIVVIIITILCIGLFVSSPKVSFKNLPINDVILICASFFWLLVALDMAVGFWVFYVFGGLQKSIEYENSKIKSKILEYGEIFQVIPSLKYDGHDMKKCLIYEDEDDVRYFAKVEENGVRIIISIRGKKEEIEPIITNWKYFDERFKIKEEQS